MNINDRHIPEASGLAYSRKPGTKVSLREGVKKNGFIWDFVPNIGPHPPTAHVWDKVVKKNVFFLQSLGP